MRYAAFLLFVLVLGCGKPSPTSEGKPDTGRAANTPTPAPDTGKPQESFPPAEWTHRDLAEHLGKKGVKVELSHAPIQDRPDRPAAFFRDGNGHALVVYLCRDGQSARESAGSLPEGFASGRFAFGLVMGTAQDKDNRDAVALLGKIRQALR